MQNLYSPIRNNFNSLQSSLFGTPSTISNVSTLSQQQQPLQNQLISAAMGQGGGTPYGDVSNYYRDLLGGSNTFNALAAPEMRQFNEEIIPSLAEQFAGMGSGGSFGGNFKAAAAQAGAGLSERLAAMRAQLRQQGSQGLLSMGQQALSPSIENIFRPREEGLFEALAKLLGNIGSVYAGANLGGKL